MSFKFPFEYADIEGLGTLFYPVIRISLKTIYGLKDFEFLVDTGADITTVPSHILPILGIKKEELPLSKTTGVAGIRVETYEFELPLKIGKYEFKVLATAVDAERNSMPLLLGRKDVFEDKFSLLIDSKNKVTVLEENK